MERLVTTKQAAELLNLSLQGVHYRIKSGQLKCIKQGGKTFVFVDDTLANNNHNSNSEQISSSTAQENIQTTQNSMNQTFEHIEQKNEKLLFYKEEQISLLKQSIHFMKEQYQNEIKRLEKNQKRIIKVFNSEIKLLQSAFNEMRSIYKPQLQMQSQTPSNQKFMPMQEFFLFLKQNDKSDDEIKIIVLNAIKQKDPRFIYNKQTKKVLIVNTDYSDLI